MFVHAVYFWLKPGTSAAARERLVDDCQQYLAKVPNVRQLWVGKPAMTPRSVVDNTYDVGLLVALDDAAGHDAYQIHPLHLEFVARNGPIFGRIQIYDFKSA